MAEPIYVKQTPVADWTRTEIMYWEDQTDLIYIDTLQALAGAGRDGTTGEVVLPKGIPYKAFIGMLMVSVNRTMTGDRLTLDQVADGPFEHRKPTEDGDEDPKEKASKGSGTSKKSGD